MTRRFALLAALLLPAITAGGCSRNVVAYGDLPDMRDRATVALRSEQKTLALFSRGTSGTIDPAQDDKIAGFAEAYRREGRGPVVVTVPSNPKAKSPQRPAGVIASLARHGVSAGSIKVRSYVPDPGVEPSVQLSFSRIAADVTCKGIEFPRAARDPGAAVLGCAYTAAVARNVADPLDLAEPRRQDLSPHRGPAVTRLATVPTLIGN